MKRENKPKIIAIVGPTASGKSGLAIEIAKKFNGEVISADSRQVYKGMNIGTGKVTKKEMAGVRHHLLDVINPIKQFTVAMFKEQAEEAIADILSRGKLPIICGGTGFYVDAVTKNISIPEVEANKKLRAQLAKKTTEQLFSELKKLDSKRANEIDKNNKVRLIRAIEIAKALGKVPEIKEQPKYEVLTIGTKTDREALKEKIYKRLIARLKVGMIAEAKGLHATGLSWKRMKEFGLEYRALARHLSEGLSKEDMIEQLYRDICRYARRQMTWFKRDKNIKWFEVTKTKEINSAVQKFLN